MVDRSHVLSLLIAYDELDSACQRVETALPYQMTGAIERLETTRIAFRRQLQEVALGEVNRTPMLENPCAAIPIPTPFVPAGCRQGMLKRAAPGTPIPRSCPSCLFGPCPYQSEVEKLP